MSAPLPRVLHRLFIFPLPDAQLFPHALLPLHVFEPRYRALTRDCLATTKLIAVPTLEPGHESEYEARPPVKAVCGVGEITQSQRHPDGRYDILVKGIGRVRILDELPPSEPYRVVRAERLDDLRAPGAELAASQQALLALCDRLATVLPSGGETLRNLAHQERDPSAAVDLIASALLTEAADRQQVLELLDVGLRLDLVTTAVAKLVSRFQPGAGSGSTRN